MTDEEKEKIREATDLVALAGETVQLRRRGRDWWGRCPFHQEKSESFHIIPSSGFWKCFGCGKGGDVFSFVMERDHVDFMEAARILADRANIEITERGSSDRPKVERNRLVLCLDETVSFYHTQLMRGRSDVAAAARAYLGGRAFGSDVCRRWRIGFAPGHEQLSSHLSAAGYSDLEMTESDVAIARNGRLYDVFYDRVIFPIEDERGRTIALGGRVFPGSPSENSEYNKAKYRNSRETRLFNKSKNLFALNRAKESIVSTGEVLVVEGYCDAITMHEAGFTNVVATLGTALTESHVKTLSRFAKRIVCMFDGDRAGQAAAEKAIRFVTQTQAQMMAVVLPDNLDPDEYINQHGADELRAVMERVRRPLIDFVFDKKLRDLDLSSPGARLASLDDMAQTFAPLKNSPVLDAYVSRIADALSVDASSVRERIKAAPIPQPDDGRTYRDRTRTQNRPARQAPQPSYDGYEDVPFDYVPSDAYDGAPAAPAAVPVPYLSVDDRNQVAVERELLALIAEKPELFKGEEERLGGISWSDARHEAIAWTILSMPPEASSLQIASAAASVCPDAPEILASARYVGSSDDDSSATARFLLDTVELHSTRRRLRQVKASLASAPQDEAVTLMSEGKDLLLRERDLLRALEQDRVAMGQQKTS